MELQEKIKKYLYIQAAILIEGVAFLIWSRNSMICGSIFLLEEFCFMVSIYQQILKPILILQREMIQCAREDDCVERVNKIPDQFQYAHCIMKLLQKYAEDRTRKNVEEIFDKQAELTALQSQINPHFLYNTLESVRGQALIDGNIEIAKMMEALSSFFRYSISGKGNLVTLREELANIQNYMMIQRYRFNNRFSLEIFIDEEDEKAYDYKIPRLIIQPVVENAIFHGLEEKLEGGEVTIEVILTEKTMIITVSDNGKGMSSKELALLNERIHSNIREEDSSKKKNHRNTGIALPNIHKRIQLLFGEEYGVSVYSTVDLGTDVEITIPTNYERTSV